MIHLTDYQIASAFQPILRSIYKDKMKELDNELSPIYMHLLQFDVPQYSDFDRSFARKCLPDWAKAHFKTIDHINRIRRIKVNENATGKELDIEGARNVPIETLYAFVFKGKNVSCPLHTDLSPSMSIKWNRVYCFQCGFKADSIGLFMKLNNVGFKEAVRSLNGSV